MNPNEPNVGRFGVAFAGAAFLSIFSAMAWMGITMTVASQTHSHLREEQIGYTMFVTAPAAGIAGAIAGVVAGFYGDRARWLRRWAIIAAVSVALAALFNVYMYQATKPGGAPQHTISS